MQESLKRWSGSKHRATGRDQMAAVELPREYGYVALVLVLYVFLNSWMASKVGRARIKYSLTSFFLNVSNLFKHSSLASLPSFNPVNRSSGTRCLIRLSMPTSPKTRIPSSSTVFRFAICRDK